LHLVGILFPHINDDARSKSHQIGSPEFKVFYLPSNFPLKIIHTNVKKL